MKQKIKIRSPCGLQRNKVFRKMVIKRCQHTGVFRAYLGDFFIPKDVRKLAIILIINMMKQLKQVLNELRESKKGK